MSLFYIFPLLSVVLKTTPASINLVNWATVGKLISVTYENLILYQNTLSYVSFSCNYMCITRQQTLQTHTLFQRVSSLVYFLSRALFPDLFNSELIPEDSITLARYITNGSFRVVLQTEHSLFYILAIEHVMYLYIKLHIIFHLFIFPHKYRKKTMMVPLIYLIVFFFFFT